MYGFFFPTFIFLAIFLVVILIIAYVKTSKLYPLLYTITVFAYINTVTYLIDSYELKANAIVLILLASAVIMILFGWHIARSSNFKDKKVMNKNKNIYKWGMIIPLIVLVFFAVLSMFNIGLSTKIISVETANAEDILSGCTEKYSRVAYQGYNVDVMNVTIKNNFFIPRKVAFDTYRVCTEPSNYYINIDFYDDENTYNNAQGVEVDPFSQKMITGSLIATCEIENVTISKIYIIDTKDVNRKYDIDCTRLTKKQKEDAIVIDVN